MERDSNPSPDEADSPAAFLRTLMEHRGWTPIDLAYVLGQKTSAGISPILNGKRGISAEMAKALAVAFDVPADDFARVQARWELRHADEPEPGVQARARVQSEFPLREMIRRGWIRESATADDLEDQLRRFFVVDTLSDLPRLAHAAKRSSGESIPAAQLAWLFRVRQIAREMPTPAYSREHLIRGIERMKMMLGDPEEIRHVPRLLHDAGIRFVVVEALPSSKIDGVCLWLDKSSPVIAMSIRFDRIDNFWFVLRHECAHVLHGHGQDAAIIDAELEHPVDTNEEERIANSEASDFCVPQEKMMSFYLRKNPFFSDRDVQAFSKIMKVHPGLVVGQLQRLAGRYDLLRKHLVGIRMHISKSALVDGWGDVVPVG